MAVSVFLPAHDHRNDVWTVIFALPGGGYSRGYFDMHFEGPSNYSKAEYHVSRGAIFIACWSAQRDAAWHAIPTIAEHASHEVQNRAR